MAGSDGAILLTTARWTGSSDESPQVYLHEVVKSGELPQLVRIVKGSYLGLGAPSLPNPSLSSTVLVASAGPSTRLAVQCLKFKDNHKTVNVGPKLAIPESFDGYFEILNEDGRAVRCIESVAELARKCPDSCLIRQSSLKAPWVPASELNPDAVLAAERSTNKSFTGGELLVLVGEVTAGSLGRFLRCLDSRGDHVYLPLDLRAKFSAVAKEDHQQGISGVHRIRALLNKRLPLTVRMVSGNPPQGLKLGTQFCYEMRLLASFREEMIVAIPLGNKNPISCNNDGVVLIPPTVSLKLQLPVNRNSLKSSKEFIRMTERCLHQYSLLSNRIQVYDAHFSKNLRFDGQHWRVPVPLLLAPLRRSTSDLIQSLTGSKKEADKPIQIEIEELKNDDKEEEEELPPEYDEIDQIYDYIRGFAPLPKNLAPVPTQRHNYQQHLYAKSTDNHRRNFYNKVMSSRNKPIPPPIETIPSIKNPVAVAPSSPVSKPRMYRQRSAMPSSITQRLYSKNPALRSSLSPAESKQSLTPSPLFNIRYKSMTNLADSDTLGSSQSGGRCSGGSAGSAAVRKSSNPTPSGGGIHQHQRPPQHHRLFQLHRPRSLTDLLWGSSRSSPLKIQLHPTVVADVIPRSINRNTRNTNNNSKLNNSGNKKHTIFYHL